MAVQFWKFPDVSPLLYSNRPNPNERRELKCSFLYTRDNLKVVQIAFLNPSKGNAICFKVLENNVTKLGEKGTDHWGIYGLMTSVVNEKGENLNIYDAKNVVKLERALTERAGSTQERRGRGQAKWSTGSAPGSTSDSSISRDLYPIAGMGETASMASIESPASTGSEGGIREGEGKCL